MDGLFPAEPERWRDRLAQARQNRRLEREAWARRGVFGALVFVTVVSSSNFNPVLLGASPDQPSNIQQVLTLAGWLVIVLASLGTTPRIRIGSWLDVAAAGSFLVYAVVSCLWSSGGSDSYVKAVALVVTSLGAYRLARTQAVGPVVDAVFLGLACVVCASLAAVLFVPEIGVLTYWMHAGQWAGIYESKQSLGVAGAFLIFFAFCRHRLRGGVLVALAGFGLGAAAVIGSGSRGGGAVALCAVLLVLLSGRNVLFSRVLAFAPFVLTLLAFATLAELWVSGRTRIELLGIETDLTERVVIWQYALGLLEPHLYVGYGLNGFWTIDDTLMTFRRQHGWVLNNFHSGYLTILMELGIVGALLFLLTTFLFGMRMAVLAASRSVQRETFTVVSAFVLLVFVYNLTETFFLRSTTLVAALLTAFFLASAAAFPERRPAASGGRAGSPRRPEATS